MILPMFCKLGFLDILSAVLGGMPDGQEKKKIEEIFLDLATKRKDNAIGFLDAESYFLKKTHLTQLFLYNGEVRTRELTEEEAELRDLGHWFEIACSDRLRKEANLPLIVWN